MFHSITASLYLRTFGARSDSVWRYHTPMMIIIQPMKHKIAFAQNRPSSESSTLTCRRLRPYLFSRPLNRAIDPLHCYHSQAPGSVASFANYDANQRFSFGELYEILRRTQSFFQR